LTLGRVKPGIRRPELVTKLLGNVSLPRLDAWQVRSVLLLRSELKPGGAVHSELFRQPLGAEPPSNPLNNPVNKDLQSP
jgi:2'-5' RNA ligase